MKIQQKLMLVVGGLALLIVFMVAGTIYTTSQQKDDGLVINLAGRQRMLSQKITKEVLQYHSLLLSGEAGKSGDVERIRESVKVFDMTLSALRDSGRAPLALNLADTEYKNCPKASGDVYGQLQVVGRLWRGFSSQVENFLRQPAKATAALNFIENNNVKLLKEMNKAVVMMQKQSEVKIKNLIIFQIVSIVIGLILAAVSVQTVRRVGRRLFRSGQLAQELGAGDLRCRFEKTTNVRDELSLLASELNGFVEYFHGAFIDIDGEQAELEQAVRDLQQVAEILAQKSSESVERIDRVKGASAVMSGDMSAVAAAMEELTTNTNQIAGATSLISSTIQEISGNSGSAQEVTEKAVKFVEVASQQVAELGEAAQKIGRVATSISEISEQTNLLALNATIEAARAGDAGKGFAVVAGEIKALANQTTEATVLINDNINWIQNSTTSTIEEIDKITDVISQVNSIVSTISMAVDEQAATIAEIDTNVGQGAIALEEVNGNVARTSIAAADIHNDMESVAHSTHDLAATGSQVAASSRQLADLSDKLKNMVKSFTV